MNWFRKLFTNPNVHIALGVAATAASVALPAWAPVFQAVAVSTGVTGIALPEQPAAPIEERQVVPRPTLHAEDYAQLAVLIAAALKDKKK